MTDIITESMETVSELVERRVKVQSYSDAVRILESVLDLAGRGYSTKDDVVRLVTDAKELLELRRHYANQPNLIW